MIEYVFIAVLVILGVVIMGPYVLRSVNAHFTLWDESVQDSVTENLVQAPVSVIPNITLNCQCTSTNAGCGGGPGSQCGPNQQIVNHLCTPQLCDGAPSSSCVLDPTCCSTWVDQGCGTTPLGQSPPPNNCNYGYQIQVQQCGANAATQCVQDSSCPLPACLGIVSPGALPCPPTGGSLTQNIGITYVADLAACSAQCQYYCNSAASYFLNATGSACTNTFTVAPNISSCTGAGACNTSGSFPLHNCSQPSKYVFVNDCSFTVPEPANATCTAVTTAAAPPGQPTDTPIAVSGDGCQNGEGEPATTCQISVNY